MYKKATLLSAVVGMAIAGTGCLSSGGSGSNGNGDSGTTLSGEQEAALAAMVGPGTADSAQDQAQEEAEADASSSSAQAAGTQVQIASSLALDCTEGELRVWDDDPDESYPPTAIHYDGEEVLDESDLEEILQDEGGDAVFTGTPAGGAFVNAQHRADCDGMDDGAGGTVEYYTFGAMDAVQYEMFSTNRVAYSAIGALANEGDLDNEVPPDTDNVQVSGTGQYGEGQAQARLRHCEGCPFGDLNQMSGDERDSAFYGFLSATMPLGDSGGSTVMELGGTDPAEYFTMKTRAGSIPDESEVLLDGRMLMDSDEEGVCSLHVNYDTQENLIIGGFEDEDTPGELRGGEIDVTLEETGEVYNVDIEGPDQIYVNGSLIDPDDFEDAC